MVKQVEVSSQEIESNVVEWHDATGWTEEILNWLLAWIQVVEERQDPSLLNGQPSGIDHSSRAGSSTSSKA